MGEIRSVRETSAGATGKAFWSEFGRRLRGAARLRWCAAAVVLLAACGGGSGTGSVDAAGTERVSTPGLSFAVPKAWVSEPPASNMRLAQYRVPGPAGDASLTVYRFPGAGGTAQANVERWILQFRDASGAPVRDSADVRRKERDSLTLTSLDVTGNYEGQQMPGGPAQPNIAEARLLALVVEGNQEPYFFKLLGPAGTVGKWTRHWDDLVESIRTESN